MHLRLNVCGKFFFVYLSILAFIVYYHLLDIPHKECRFRGMESGISEASKRVSIFSFATQGGKQVSFYFRQGNWVQARDAQIRFPAG